MKIYIIPFRVRRLKESIMPKSFSGAYVSCYSHADNYAAAAQNALTRLSADGLYPEEILQPIHEMDAEDWSQHISERWPDQADSLPSQIEFEDAMKKNNVVYGPFGSYA